MRPIRLSSEARRETILAAAKGCFAQHGFAGTTTKSVATAAGISEGLLFKHFASKSALYAAILDEVCEADSDLRRLQSLEPSTATLVHLISEMVRHFLSTVESRDGENFQRMKLLLSSYLEDGEFARLLYSKIDEIVGPSFVASFERAVAAGDVAPTPGPPMNLFWFCHQMIHMVALTQIPKVTPLSYGLGGDFERQVCEFTLRGIGLNEHAIARYLKHTTTVCPHETQLVSEGA